MRYPKGRVTDSDLMVRYLVCQTKQGRCFVLGLDSPTVLVVHKKPQETGSLPLIKFFSLFEDSVRSISLGPFYNPVD